MSIKGNTTTENKEVKHFEALMVTWEWVTIKALKGAKEKNQEAEDTVRTGW